MVSFFVNKYYVDFNGFSISFNIDLVRFTYPTVIKKGVLKFPCCTSNTFHEILGLFMLIYTHKQH